MTMIIAVKSGNSIIMTADKRITISDRNGNVISHSDDAQKVVKINNNTILSFAGRAFIAEQAIQFISDRSNELIGNDYKTFFRKAFIYGKERFEETFQGVPPTSVFFVGQIHKGHQEIIGYSSDDSYTGIEIDATIKINGTENNEDRLIEESITYIEEQIQLIMPNTIDELVEIYHRTITKVEDVCVGNTTYSLILSPSGIKEYHLG
jgi:hypothetical protein